MARWLVLVVVAVAAGGCATVKVMQRGGCWVKQTETFPRTIREEVGPCARAEPKWSEDRVTRLVQECLAEADYTWQMQAVSQWNKGLPMPPRLSEQSVMRECLDHAATALVAENESLKRRVSELFAEREALQKVTHEDRQHLRSSQDHMTSALGEAAKKPAPSASAIAHGTGTASSPPPAPLNVEMTVPVGPPGAAMPAPPVEAPPLCAPVKGGSSSRAKNGAPSVECTPPKR